MSFRPHGRAETNSLSPSAWGVCDRCGFLYNHKQLRWQYDWRGTHLQNLRILVCEPCYDDPQQNGQRTIILPADPIPIQNARPEFYVSDNNPLSALGANPSPLLWQYSGQIGNMVNAGGVPAAFDGNANKPSFMSAMIANSNSSYDNYVGINWSGYPASIVPSSLNSPVLTHTLASFTITAPNDSTFGSSSYVVQASSISSDWSSAVTVSSGGFAGAVGEIVTGIVTNVGRYQYHRVGFYENLSNILTSSDGTILTSSTGDPLTTGGESTPIAVAQVSFFVSDGSS